MKLANGIELNYHIITNITSVSLDSIRIIVSSFKDKEIYQKAISKSEKIEKQKQLFEEFSKLAELEKPKKSQVIKMETLQKNINNLSDEIGELKDFEKYVLYNFEITTDFMQDFSIKSIENLLVETDTFKLAIIE